MFRYINGYNKERVMEKIRAGNHNSKAATSCADRIGMSCMYITPSGNKCFIGCFIPDRHEGQKSTAIVTGLLKEFPDLIYNMPIEVSGLYGVQCTHDNAAACEDLYQLAEKWLESNVSEGVA